MSSVPKPTAPTEMDVEMQVFDDSSGGGVASSSENSESSASDASEINVGWIRVLKLFGSVDPIRVHLKGVKNWFNVTTTATFELILNEALTGIYLTRRISDFNHDKGRTVILFSDLLRVVPCVCKEHCEDVRANQDSLHPSDYGKSFLLEANVPMSSTTQIILTANSVDECFQICKMLSLCRQRPNLLTHHRHGVGSYITREDCRALIRKVKKRARVRSCGPRQVLLWCRSCCRKTESILAIGLLVEVAYYDQLVIEATSRRGKRGQLYIPMLGHRGNLLFGPEMYCTGEIQAYNKETKRYNVKFLEGPFNKKEVVHHKHKSIIKLFRPDTEFPCLPRQRIQVEQAVMFGHKPYFMVIWCSIQLFMFFSYCIVTNTTPRYSSPVAGKPFLWFKLLGDDMSTGGPNDDFPNCGDLRLQLWRFWTYQFVHVGYSHVCFNVLLQLMAGIPLEMAHGSWRLFVLYQAGVFCGGLNSALGDVYTSVVGSSGGGYCLVGIHMANVIMNWSELKRPICNRWAVLLMLGFIFCVEFVEALSHRAEKTSYSAHYGGFVAGVLLGILLLRSPVQRCHKRYLLIPLAGLLMCIGVGGGLWWIFNNSPPRFAYHLDGDTYGNKPCCWQVLDCQGLKKDDYKHFRCSSERDSQDRTMSTVIAENIRLPTCEHMLNYTYTL